MSFWLYLFSGLMVVLALIFVALVFAFHMTREHPDG